MRSGLQILTAALLPAVLTMMLGGCGGGLGGVPADPGGGGTGQNGSNPVGEQPGDSGDSSPAFSVRILPDPPLTEASLDDVILLSALTLGQLQLPVYSWSVTPAESAVLEDPAADQTEVFFNAPATFIITLVVTDLATGVMAQDTLALRVEEIPEPPAGAALDVVPVPPARIGDLVSLLVSPVGAMPLSIEWRPDPTNIVTPGQLLFLDVGGGLATLTIPTIFNFPYELRFTVTATYDNAGVLSEDLVVMVN